MLSYSIDHSKITKEPTIWRASPRDSRVAYPVSPIAVTIKKHPSRPQVVQRRKSRLIYFLERPSSHLIRGFRQELHRQGSRGSCELVVLCEGPPWRACELPHMRITLLTYCSATLTFPWHFLPRHRWSSWKNKSWKCDLTTSTEVWTLEDDADHFEKFIFIPH